MSLGSHIAMLRKSKGLTQTDLAGQLNAHQSIVNRWERDHVVPRRTTLERLAEALDTTVEELKAGPSQQPSRGEPKEGRKPKDERLNELVSQLHKLRSGDLDALMVVIDAMLTKSRVQEAIGG